MDAFKAVNANGAKISVAALLGLNNNNHITNNNETRSGSTNINGLKRQPKEDYEEAVNNGDMSSIDKDYIK